MKDSIQEAIRVLNLYDYSTKLELSEGVRNKVCDTVTYDSFQEMKELAILSLRKQSPVGVVSVVGEGAYKVASCFNCGFGVDNRFAYCYKCGQKLKWQ